MKRKLNDVNAEKTAYGVASKRNGLIEIYRFIFSLCVVSCHAQFLANAGYVPLIGGVIAVEFFFILSGYLLYSSAQKKTAILSRVTISQETVGEVLKRIKHIYPYFFVTWAASFILYHVENEIFNIHAIIMNFLQSIGQLLFLTMAGLGGVAEGVMQYNGTIWYVSALLIVILFCIQ